MTKTFAHLPKVKKDRVIDEFTVRILAAYFPSGCRCDWEGRCGWCRAWQPERTRVKKLLNRMLLE